MKAQDRHILREIVSYHTNPSSSAKTYIKWLAEKISLEQANKYLTEGNFNISDILNHPRLVENKIRQIAETNIPTEVSGILIDTFTARLLLTVSEKLNESNRYKFYKAPIPTMVATAYKLLTY